MRSASCADHVSAIAPTRGAEIRVCAVSAALARGEAACTTGGRRNGLERRSVLRAVALPTASKLVMGVRFPPPALYESPAQTGFLFARWAILRGVVSAISPSVSAPRSQTACDCRRIERHLALVEDAIQAVREAQRLLPGDECLREEERLLLDLQARIEERLALLAA